MRAPQPLALGCISLVLCLLELPHGTALPLPQGGHRRDPPDRRPLPTASLLGDHLGLQPLALAQPVGTAGHSPKRLVAPQHRLFTLKGAPRHRLLTSKAAPRHRLLTSKAAPRHRLFTLKAAPRHRLFTLKGAPRHRLLALKGAPRHRLLTPKLVPRHRLLTPKLVPRLGAHLSPRRGHRLLLRHRHSLSPRRGHPAVLPRGRRHASGHLLRVGCVLGTCQVQNLSHRLWQLMGQSGRQDSSPMNPNSPHSYG